jgi:hypothetical protein
MVDAVSADGGGTPMIENTPLTPRAVSDTIPAQDTDKAFWLAMRQALLMQLDAIERRLGISPTTAELRRASKLQVN